MRVALVSCSSMKLDRAAPARELYCSPLFRMSLEYATRTCDRTFIVSAMHGLVDVEQQLSPYDLALSSLAKAARGEWGDRVLCELEHRVGAVGVELVVLAGKDYADALASSPAALRYEWSFPLARLQLGERLHFLSDALAPESHGQRRSP